MLSALIGSVSRVFLGGIVVIGMGGEARGAGSTWQAVRLGGGGFVTGVSYHPAESGVAYARTDVGGAYRWKPDLDRWVPLNDDLGRDDSQLTRVVSLVLDAQDPERVFLACGQYLPT
ncbi:MAG: hypothetical protein J6386_13845 [Candidatus Synoicihabitans palmerolidicus]|nr:hypothetical protein [Candidatus Synoicihabitans palmerolidicus]